MTGGRRYVLISPCRDEARFRYGDAAFRRFLRRYQYDCLLRGKREATRRLDAAQEPVWRLAHPHASASEEAHVER